MDDLLTLREVAGKLKISTSTMYRYVGQGMFPHVRIGPNIRFKPEHIDYFMSMKLQKEEIPSEQKRIIDFYRNNG
jgi:excisionase family DNA binding protein